MSDGEIVFLALVMGCFAAFAVSVMWLRADYVKRRPSTVDHQRMQMAE